MSPYSSLSSEQKMDMIEKLAGLVDFARRQLVRCHEVANIAGNLAIRRELDWAVYEIDVRFLKTFTFEQKESEDKLDGSNPKPEPEQEVSTEIEH